MADKSPKRGETPSVGLDKWSFVSWNDRMGVKSQEINSVMILFMPLVKNIIGICGIMYIMRMIYV